MGEEQLLLSCSVFLPIIDVMRELCYESPASSRSTGASKSTGRFWVHFLCVAVVMACMRDSSRYTTCGQQPRKCDVQQATLWGR